MRPTPWSSTLPFVLMLLFISWSQAETFLKIGHAERDITPPNELINWITKEAYPGVLDPLYVRSTYLYDGQTEVVLLSWDLLDAHESSVDEVTKQIEETTGIPASNMIVNASHTHSAPWSPRPLNRWPQSNRKGIFTSQSSDVFERWSHHLYRSAVEAANESKHQAQTVTPMISRVRVPEVLFNRRPRDESNKVVTTFRPTDPYTLPNGLRFGPVDDVVKILWFDSINTKKPGESFLLFHLPCHSVSIYSADSRYSGDWSSRTIDVLKSTPGLNAQFLQGCAGDIVPSDRGIAARETMAELIANRITRSKQYKHPLSHLSIRVASQKLALPLREEIRKQLKIEFIPVELRAISIGPLAMITLPGEPLTGLAIDIKEASPFPHTWVLGYSNGHGVHYVGREGERELGGYEMGLASHGQDECGTLLTEAAVELLHTLQQKDN